MNISSEISFNDGSNFSDHNSTKVQFFEMASLVDIFTILLSLPTNSYVIWLIVSGTGNGITAEFFSLNLAVCEMLFCVESVLSLLMMYKFQILWIAVDFLDGLAITGRPLFQCLLCAECYLAVVHPVTFLKYTLRYKVICSFFAWVAGFVSCGVNIMILLLLLTELYYAFFFAQVVLFLLIQLFCCVAVLRALKQSGPGERGRERGEENHTKRRAFYLILITNVSMVILFAPYIFSIAPEWIQGNTPTLSPVAYVSFTLISLVQPILFLYRVGKLPFIKCE